MTVGATTQEQSIGFPAKLKAFLGAVSAKLKAVIGGGDKALGPYVEKLSSLFSGLGKIGNQVGWGVALVTVAGTWLKTGTFDFATFAKIDVGMSAWISQFFGAALAGWPGLPEGLGPTLANAINAVQGLMAQTLLNVLPENFAAHVNKLGWGGLTTVVQTLTPVAQYTPASALVILGAGAVRKTLADEQEKRAKSAQANKVQVNS